jgi:biopolymer transport protein ExbD
MARRERRKLGSFTGIDVTPLVDLTFLLLIVFMITAPTLEFALDVDPPGLEAKPVDPDDHKLVNLDRHGKLTYDSRNITQQQLGTEFQKLASTLPDMQVFVRADEGRPYGEVMAIMRVARQAGVTNVSLVTESEE